MGNEVTSPATLEAALAAGLPSTLEGPSLLELEVLAVLLWIWPT